MILVFDFSRVILFPKDEGYQGSLNKLFQKISLINGFKFEENYYLNQELLDYLETIKDKYDLIVFTSGLLHEHPEVAPKVSMFKRFIKTSDLGVSKEDPNAFEKLAELLGVNKTELVFIDDSKVNILAAEKAGLLVHRYRNNRELVEFLEQV